MELSQLARRVARDIETYMRPDRHPSQMGSDLPPEWFEAGLADMLRALVTPYFAKVRDYDTALGEIHLSWVIIIADDSEGTLLAFDPSPDGDFALVWRHPDHLALSNIRGDSVGCFLSR